MAGFTSSVARVDAGDLGASWRKGCPVGPADLRAVTLAYRGFDGARHVGVLVVHEDVVGSVVAAFRRLYDLGFPIRSMRPVSAYGASDDASMAADNTSAFNCRRAVAAGPPSWSRHAYGKAIDVNPVENPYLFQGDVLPPAGAAYRSRAKARPGLFRRGDAAVRAFTDQGFRWGAAFSSPDYQHFDR
ncbi:MAG: M15 family metallopeptidase [Kineosporiaceae bacterium]